MIDSMFQAGTNQALDDANRRPLVRPEPAPGFSLTQLAKAPIQGIGSAASKAIAFGAEITGAFGDVAGSYPEMFGPVQLTDEQRKQAEQSRNKLLKQGPSFSNEAGDLFRARSHEIMPDPNTTHASAQVLAGLSEFMGSAVGYTLTTGPLAPLALGLDVGMSESDRLKQMGVDEPTRTKAGAVAGVVAGGSIVLPLTGATAAGRFAKGAAIGEGSMVGQTLAEKAILQHAGYDKIADTFDPLDPVMLAMGVVPGAFAAKFGAPKPIKAPRTEAEMRSAAALTPAEQAKSAAFEASPANLAELEAAIKAEKNPVNRALLVQELETQRTAAARKVVADNPELVAAARVMQTADALERSRLTPDTDLAGRDAHLSAVEMAGDQMAAGEPVRVQDIVQARKIPTLDEWLTSNKVEPDRLPPEVKGDFLAWIKRAGGIDLGLKYDLTGERSGILSNPGGIFRKGGRGLDELASQAANEGGYMRPEQASDSRAFADLVQSAVRGERVLNFEQQMQHAQRVAAESDLMARQEAAHQQLRTLGIDPAAAKGNVRAMERYLDEHRPALLGAALDEFVSSARAAEAEANLPPAPPSRAQGAIDRARQGMQDVLDNGTDFQEYLQNATLTPEARNLMVGLKEAGTDTARAQRLLDTFDRAARIDQQAPLMDIAADAVESARSGEQAKAGSAIDSAAQEVALLNPDMMVQLDGMNEPMRVGDFLEAVKREAANDAAGARLVEVAAQCALRNL